MKKTDHAEGRPKAVDRRPQDESADWRGHAPLKSGGTHWVNRATPPRKVAVTLGRPIVTSDFVIIEVGNFLSGLTARKQFTPFIRSLRRDPQTTIIPASAELVTAGIQLYLDRADKAWSLTDCISFEVMRQRGITEALTADRHFEQAGFTVLLKSVP